MEMMLAKRVPLGSASTWPSARVAEVKPVALTRATLGLAVG
jgi:hypothetical protein